MRGPASAAAPTVLTNSLRKRPRVFSSAIGALLVDVRAILRTHRERATAKSGGMLWPRDAGAGRAPGACLLENLMPALAGANRLPGQRFRPESPATTRRS